MQRLGVAVAALVLCAVAPLAASASLIVPVSQTRSVSASAAVTGGQPSSSSFSASDFGPWDQAANAYSTRVNPSGFMSTGVRQRSVIGESSFSSEIDGAMLRDDFGGGSGSTQSVFDVTFDLTAPASYEIGNGNYASFLSGHVVTLYDANGQVIAQPGVQLYPIGHPEFVTPSVGVLDAGRYRINVQWNRNFVSDFYPDSTFDAVMFLRFTPVPEPGTALLVALGLGGLAARRQRT